MSAPIFQFKKAENYGEHSYTLFCHTAHVFNALDSLVDLRIGGLCFERKEVIVPGQVGFYELDGKNVSIVNAGIGAFGGALKVQELIERYGSFTILNLGSTGYLSDEADLFDLVVPSKAVEFTGLGRSMSFDKSTVGADEELGSHLLEVARAEDILIRQGDVWTCVYPPLLETSESVQAAICSGAVCVDMESYLQRAVVEMLNRKDGYEVRYADVFYVSDRFVQEDGQIVHDSILDRVIGEEMKSIQRAGKVALKTILELDKD